MRCCSSSTRSSCSRSERFRDGGRTPAARTAVLVLVALAVWLVGCGGSPTSGTGGRAGELEPGGTLTVAVAGDVATIDPLRVSTRTERLVSRQVYEPLRTWQTGPFGEAKRRPGLARTVRPSPDASVWTVVLRDGVEFQDGEPLDADAVLLNVDRWTSGGAAPPLPRLSADSPRPGRVRFILARPSEDFGDALADPRLAIVAPGALIGLGRGELGTDAAGTGPFEYRDRGSGSILLARNAAWWGSDLGLGPGVDQIDFRIDRVAGHRLADLLSGAVQIADDLGRRARDRIGAAPLVTTVPGRAATVGIERSVRGMEAASAAQSLADVWLTDLR
ncbi:MAG: ABC transporter substrate-binding protein [Solirubrobacterales bacterium]